MDSNESHREIKTNFSLAVVNAPQQPNAFISLGGFALLDACFFQILEVGVGIRFPGFTNPLTMSTLPQ
jgi:hypothetical protein